MQENLLQHPSIHVMLDTDDRDKVQVRATFKRIGVARKRPPGPGHLDCPLATIHHDTRAGTS